MKTWRTETNPSSGLCKRNQPGMAATGHRPPRDVQVLKTEFRYNFLWRGRFVRLGAAPGFRVFGGL
jgi:hypothetical protein